MEGLCDDKVKPRIWGWGFSSVSLQLSSPSHLADYKENLGKLQRGVVYLSKLYKRFSSFVSIEE